MTSAGGYTGRHPALIHERRRPGENPPCHDHHSPLEQGERSGSFKSRPCSTRPGRSLPARWRAYPRYLWVRRTHHARWSGADPANRRRSGSSRPTSSALRLQHPCRPLPASERRQRSGSRTSGSAGRAPPTTGNAAAWTPMCCLPSGNFCCVSAPSVGSATFSTSSNTRRTCPPPPSAASEPCCRASCR